MPKAALPAIVPIEVATATNPAETTNAPKNAVTKAKEQGYEAIYANCKKINQLSHKVFLESSFKEYEMKEDEYIGIGIKKSDIPKNIALKYDLE